MAAVVCGALSDTIDQAKWDAYLSTLPEPIMRRIVRFHRACDRRARILSMWLLETLLARFDLHRCLQRLAWTETGRPYLSGVPHLDFNLSHSGDLVIVAVVESGRVGIDLEQQRDLELKDFRTVFSKPVWTRIVSSLDPLQTFFQMWTRLESVAKAEGYGLGGPIQSIRLEKARAYTPDRSWHITELSPLPGYACHMSTDRPISRPDIEWCSFGASGGCNLQ